jgi:hypothetical protein
MKMLLQDLGARFVKRWGSFRDSIAADDLVICADIAEYRAQDMKHSTETPADFLLFAFMYNLERSDHIESSRLLQRIRRFSKAYDPSSRFSPSTRPLYLDNLEMGIYEAGNEKVLAKHVVLFMERHPDFDYESLRSYFTIRGAFDRHTLACWLPKDDSHIDIRLDRM